MTSPGVLPRQLGLRFFAGLVRWHELQAEASGVQPLRIPRLHPQSRFRARHRSAAGPVLGPTQDMIPVRGRAQRFDQEQPQVNRVAEQDAVLPSVRAEHALMNLRGSLFYAVTRALIRPSAETAESRLRSQRAVRRSIAART